jgi:hypothetical protein
MATKYATASELEGHKLTVAQMERVESDPGLNASIQDRSAHNKRKAAAKKVVETLQAPAPKDDSERESLRRRQNMLEAFIKLDCREIQKPAMPSQHDMWNPAPSTIGKHRTWEHAIKGYTLDPNNNPVKAADGYGAISEWKDNQRRLRGEEEEMDPNIANIELLRPQNYDSVSAVDYRKIVTAGSPLFKENYDEVFTDHVPTPVEAKIAAVKKEKVICGFLKVNGQKCASTPLPGKAHCRWHEPKL